MAIKTVINDDATGLNLLVDDSGENKVDRVQLNHAGDVYAVNGKPRNTPIPIEEFLEISDLSKAMETKVRDYSRKLAAANTERVDAHDRAYSR